MKSLRWVPVILLVSAGCGYFLDDPKLESAYRVPRGFTAQSALPEGEAPTLIQITFDSLGRPVVSKERGQPTILLDNDGDGVFESEKVFTDKIEYAQGMFFDGRTLYAIANGAETGEAGFYRLEDTDGDDTADTFEKLSGFVGDMGEHGPHDIRRSLDGDMTVLLGNHTAVPEEHQAGRPIFRNYSEGQLLPRYMDAIGHAVDRMMPGGAIYRFDPEGAKYNILLGGFRNPYNHAYNGHGEIFTFDSDMEWDINLPWYRPVRSVHAVPGGDYGWRTGSGKLPNYYIETLPPIEEVGRGSPVGVQFYRHYSYPEEYFDSFIQGDWSRGRILVMRMERDGATYKTAGEPLEFVYGEPLNVTDVEVGPDGAVYFTMGGRDTQGGLYRVDYRGYRSNESAHETEGVMAAVRQPQPLSAWGHARLQEIKQELGAEWQPQLKALAEDDGEETYDRVQAVMLLERFGPQPGLDWLQTLMQAEDPLVRAAAVRLTGRRDGPQARSLAVAALGDEDPFVQRRAAEALRRQGLAPENSSPEVVEALYPLLGHGDRFLRYAARIALEDTRRELWAERVIEEDDTLAATEGLAALARTAEKDIDLEPALEKGLSLLKQGPLDPENELRLIRAVELVCMGFKDGCRPTVRQRIHNAVFPRFPAGDERLNKEYAMLLAYCGQEETAGKLLAAMPPGDENQPLQIHYVYCLRVIEEGWSSEQKQTLLAWFAKARGWRGGASFPGFINRLFTSSLDFFNEEEKQLAYERIPEFAPVDEAEAGQLKRGNYQAAAVYARQERGRGVSEQEIFEYLMYDPMTLVAKPEDGEELFEKECSKCHRFGEIGEDFGPDLTTIANRFTRRDIVEAVLWPSKTISDQYQSYVVETKEGGIFLGLIVSEDDEKIVMRLPDETQPIAIPKSSVKDRRRSDVSTMPEGALDAYGMKEIAALFAYLQSGVEQAGAKKPSD